ncbi:MAG: hypothetical protein Q9M46_05320 [Ghiorsea sp.]|nr:hypothetical protein [Ghiorsea sp.]
MNKPLQKSVKSFLSHPVTITIFWVGAVLIAFQYEEIKDKIGGEDLLIGLVLMGIVMILIVVKASFFHRTKSQDEFEGYITKIKGVLEGVHAGWLISEENLVSLERESKNTWVFTNDLANDINMETDASHHDGKVFQAVSANLKKGHRYTYFVPDTRSINAKINKYFHIHDIESGQVKFILVPEKEFDIYSEVVVYNAESGYELIVEWLPNVDANFYVKMCPTHAQRVMGVAATYVDRFSS